MRERKLLRDSHVHSHETQSVHKIGWETGWAHSLLSLAFAARWNQKHPSYVSIRLFFKNLCYYYFVSFRLTTVVMITQILL